MQRTLLRDWCAHRRARGLPSSLSLGNLIRAPGRRQRMWLQKPGTSNPLHTQEPVTVASFRTWRGWREDVARD